MYTKSILSNGLRVLTSTMLHTRAVSLSMYFGAGSRYENDPQAGISHFVEHMLFKGTARRPRPEDVSGPIENVGGIQNAATDRELTVYWCKVARPHFEMGMDVLQDMVHHSLFDSAEIEKERNVILEELSQVQDSPPELAGLLIDETLWPNQPLGRDVAGSKESVAGINRTMLLEYLRQQYDPSNAVVSVAGNVAHEEVVALLQTSLGEWQAGPPVPYRPAQNGQQTPRVRLLSRKTEQAHLCLALPGLPTNHPDRHTLALLNIMLGEGMTSRLFLEIRERRGLAYDVHSYVSHFLDAGALTIYSGVDPKNALDTLKAAMDLLFELRNGVGEEELSRAKELAKGRLMLRMEDTRAVSSWMGAQELLTGRVNTLDEVTEFIDAVTTEDIQRVARSLITKQLVNLAVVGPFRSEGRFAKAIGA